MAKKNVEPTKNEKSVATPPTEADTQKKAVGRPKGQSTKDGDIFTACDPQPENIKIAPQAQQIVNLVIAAGKKGVTRKDLVASMDGVVVTRQPQGRILSYYQKLITENAMVTITPDTTAAPAAETAPAAE
jgi:hypothetical protein